MRSAMSLAVGVFLTLAFISTPVAVAGGPGPVGSPELESAREPPAGDRLDSDSTDAGFDAGAVAPASLTLPVTVPGNGMDLVLTPPSIQFSVPGLPPPPPLVGPAPPAIDSKEMRADLPGFKLDAGPAAVLASETARDAGADALEDARDAFAAAYAAHCAVRKVNDRGCDGPLQRRHCFINGDPNTCENGGHINTPQPQFGPWDLFQEPGNCNPDGGICLQILEGLDNGGGRELFQDGVTSYLGNNENSEVFLPELDDRPLWEDAFHLVDRLPSLWEAAWEASDDQGARPTAISSHGASVRAPGQAGLDSNPPLSESPLPSFPGFTVSFGVMPIHLSLIPGPSDVEGVEARTPGTPGVSVQAELARTTAGAAVAADASASSVATPPRDPPESVVPSPASALAALPPGAVSPSPLTQDRSLAILLLGLCLLLPLLALYHRVRKDRALDNPQRRAVHDAVLAQPGITPGELSRATGMHYTSCEHHLQLLQDIGLVVILRFDGRMRCFENHNRYGCKETRVLAAARNPTAREVLSRVLRTPGITPAELAHDLGITRPGVKRHVDRLVSWGLLAAQREGARLHLRVKPEAVDAVLLGLGAGISSTASPAQPDNAGLSPSSPGGAA